jgi:hypothetical protein
MNWTWDQQGPGHPKLKKISIYYNILIGMWRAVEPLRRPPFLPGGKICRLRHAKEVSVIA